KPLGSGNFGTVYKASWLNDNAEQTIAVKRFNHIAEENIASLSSAVKLMQQVKHEHIIAIYGLNIDNEQRTLLLMEYAENGSLYNYIYADKRDYNQELALHWMYQCAKGLEYLHAQTPKVIHRDLKTHNLLLTNKYRTLKICDFGTVTEMATRMTAEVGTAYYMAPEVAYLKQNNNYTEKCDIYSFGIVLWEVLTRRKPFYHLPNSNSISIIYNVVIDGK
ncbi:Takl1, partial [Drosophila busckii]